MDLPHTRGLAPVVLALITLAVATVAEGDYTRPTTKPPTPADLELTQGRHQTVVFRILNLTPYNIGQYTNTFKQIQEYNRSTHEPMMYAPVGWPNHVSALAGQWVFDEGKQSWAYQPTPDNHQVHPLNFVATWNDQGGYVSDSYVGWSVENVYNAAHAATATVEMRLWLTRVKPSDKMISEEYPLIGGALLEIADIIGVVTDPENPIAWLDVFVATKELTEKTIEAMNEKDDGTDKMYVAAYTLPQTCAAGLTCTPGIQTVSTSGEGTDAVAVQWPSTNGENTANVVVSVHVQRGAEFQGVNSRNGCCGTLPVVGIVVWTPDEFTWAVSAYEQSQLTRDPVGRRIHDFLRQDKRQHYTQFIHTYNALDAKQRAEYHAAFGALQRHRSLTAQQKQVLEYVLADLEGKHVPQKGEKHEPRRK